MTISPGRAMLLSTVTEEQFIQFVLAVAKRNNWRTYHTRDSRRSASGFPDVIAVRGSRLMIAELKSARGQVQPEQSVWLSAFKDVPGVEVHVWRPADEIEIWRVLA